VRLNQLGTVEMRGTDSNYPEVILAIAALIYNAAKRVRQENITVRPAEGAQTFVLKGNQLSVPEYEYLNGDLLYAAATEGVKSSAVAAYLESILKFALIENSEEAEYLTKFSSPIRDYQTTESEVWHDFAPATAQLAQEEGLRLVRESCNKFAEQVESLYRQHPAVSASTSSA
jgi:carboxylate-amine ligase